MMIHNNCGICKCSGICHGKGCGNGDGECKGVTIAIFEKGKILITGARNKDQLITCKKIHRTFY